MRKTKAGALVWIDYCDDKISLYELALGYNKRPKKVYDKYREYLNKHKSPPPWQYLIANNNPYHNLQVYDGELMTKREIAERKGINPTNYYKQLSRARKAERVKDLPPEPPNEEGTEEWNSLSDKPRGHNLRKIQNYTEIERKLWQKN